jgi:hypothetical protein
VVAAVGHVDRRVAGGVVAGDPPDHNAGGDRRRGRQRHVDDRLEQVGCAPAEAAVGGDDHLALGVVDAVGQGVGREPAEHHRVGGADAGAGQHGDRQLGDHRHVDGDPVAALDAQALEHVGEALHLGQQVGVGDGAGVAGLALPVVGDLVALPRIDVAVEAVAGHVELPAHEPLGERQLPLEDGVPVFVPGHEVGGLLGPEALPVALGLVVDLGVDDQGVLLEALGRRERAVLDQEVLDRSTTAASLLIGHCTPPFRVVRATADTNAPHLSPK